MFVFVDILMMEKYFHRQILISNSFSALLTAIYDVIGEKEADTDEPYSFLLEPSAHLRKHAHGRLTSVGRQQENGTPQASRPGDVQLKYIFCSQSV